MENIENIVSEVESTVERAERSIKACESKIGEYDGLVQISEGTIYNGGTGKLYWM